MTESHSQQMEMQAFDGLAPEQQQRLADVLDACFETLEAGGEVDSERLIAEHPDLQEPLKCYLNGLKFLQNAAAGFHPTPDLDAWDGDSQTPQQIGEFEIVRELGRGGMGIVYEARQRSLNRLVALKVLPFASLLSASQIARFRNEAHAAAQIEHPGIIPVFAIGSDRGLHYFAMQRIEGAPFSDLVETMAGAPKEPGDTAYDAVEAFTSRREADFPAFCRSVAKLGADAARALQAAHDESIVHRDVKPSNLMLDKRGKVWVADFGLARCRGSRGTRDLTGAEDLLGTMRYMSPEQAMGEWVDHRTDVYSLGATLYELLTLRPAIRGESTAEMLLQLESSTPYRLRTWDARFPADLDNVIRKAMSKSAEERYRSCGEFAEDLQRFVDGEPTRARGDNLWRRVSRWSRRHHRVLAATWAVMVLLCTVLFGAALVLNGERMRTAAALKQAESNGLEHQFQRACAEHQFALVNFQMGRRDEARTALDACIGGLRQMLTGPIAAAERTELKADVTDRLCAALQLSATIRPTSDGKLALQELNEALKLHFSLDSTDVERPCTIKASIAELHFRQTRFEEALAIYEDLAKLRNDESKRYPTSFEHALEAAIAANNLGQTWARLGDKNAAKQAYLDATERLTKFSDVELGAEKTYQKDRRLRVLSAIYKNRAKLAFGMEEWDEADRFAILSLEHQESVNSQSHNSSAAADLCAANVIRAKTAFSVGKLDNALDAVVSAVQGARGNREILLECGQILYKIESAAKRQGNIPSVLARAGAVANSIRAAIGQEN